MARAFPALVRKLKVVWKRPLQLQLCNVHAMRRLFEYKKDLFRPYRMAKQRFLTAEKDLKENTEQQAVRQEYWSARQQVKFHWRMVSFCLSLISRVIAAPRKSDIKCAQSELNKVLQELATLPSDYQAYCKELT